MGSKQLILNLIANIISLIVSISISFILTPFLISTVGKEAYAFYPLANNFVSYMSIISVALNSMVSRFITIEIVQKNFNYAKQYYSSLFFANCILVIVFSIPLALIVFYLNYILNIPVELAREVKILFLLVFLSMLINLLTTVFGVATFAKNRFDLSSIKDIIQDIFKLSLFLILLNIFKPTIIIVGIIIVILSISNFIIQYYLTKKLLPNLKISFSYFKGSLIKKVLKSGIWNSINSLGNTLMVSISLLFANIFISATAAGDLAIVQVIPQFLSLIITVISSIFIPRFTHHYATNNKFALVYEIKLSQKVLSIFTTIPIILLICFGSDFFMLWVPYEDTKKLYLLLILSIIPLFIHGNMWVLIGLNTVLDQVKVPSLILIGFGILNIVFCYIGLSYTDLGVAIIPSVYAIISVLYYLILIPIYSSKKLNLNFFSFYPTIIKSLISITFFVFIILKQKSMFHIKDWLDFFYCVGIIGLISITLYSLIILKKTELKKVISYVIKK